MLLVATRGTILFPGHSYQQEGDQATLAPSGDSSMQEIAAFHRRRILVPEGSSMNKPRLAESQVAAILTEGETGVAADPLQSPRGTHP